METIDAQIHWKYPMTYENIFSSKEIKNNGIYQITRVFRNKEILLYIGKAYQLTFEQRLNDKKWLNDYKGIKYVRLGLVYIPEKYLKPHRYEDIESGLIYELNPQHNSKKTITYNPTNLYNIFSLGYRGLVPKNINMQNQ